MTSKSRAKVSFFKNPLTTVQYASCEMFIQSVDLIKMLPMKRYIFALCTLATSVIMSPYLYKSFYSNKNSAFIHYVSVFNKKMYLCVYWLILGIISSIGLGTGLHTFLLYLGPFIATVTIAAWECGTVQFPDPPYPYEITCPQQIIIEKNSTIILDKLTLLDIMQKLKFSIFFWGLGTAIGELPPYFMARAARQANNLNSSNNNSKTDSLMESELSEEFSASRFKKVMCMFIERFGFWGILLFASIPNPLFDLAGMACGHFMVPFRTFFLATVLGKSLIKCFMQSFFVAFCFTPHYVSKIFELIEQVPMVGQLCRKVLNKMVELQREKFHKLDNIDNLNLSGSGGDSASYYLSKAVPLAFEGFVLCAVLYFLTSILSSLANQYLIRFHASENKTLLS